MILPQLHIPADRILNVDWVEVKEVQSKILIERFRQLLDLREAEAIALAIETQVNYLLIDEKVGWKIASDNQLNIVGEVLHRIRPTQIF